MNVKRINPEKRGFPTIEQLAEIAGVSRRTVTDRVLELKKMMQQEEQPD